MCLLPRCGDGYPDPGETCDDGNNNLNDHCPDGPGGTCQTATCGDGFVWNTDAGHETCDDGNTNNFDGCAYFCRKVTTATISAGASHTCALLEYGSAWCWGRDYYGQLGDGPTTHAACLDGDCSHLPVWVSGWTNAVDISAGAEHSCALKDDGTAWCWGLGSDGRLGNGSTSHSNAPAQVVDLTNAVAISAGYEHSCALTGDGTAWCWGKNNYGQLGDGSTSDSSTIVQVSGLTTAVTISAGYEYSCAVLSDGTAWCWGGNYYGQLGDGQTTHENCGSDDCSPIPVQVSDLSNAVTISAGGGHSCALTGDGWAWCWGDNNYGQLGDGQTSHDECEFSFDCSWTPVEVTVNQVTAISAGGGHTCALTDGTAWCWGSNYYGQLGDGYMSDSSTPIHLGLGGASAISAGLGHSCAVVLDGTTWCWGSNYYGQLGDGQTTHENCGSGDCSPIPVRVGGPPPWDL